MGRMGLGQASWSLVLISGDDLLWTLLDYRISEARRCKMLRTRSHRGLSSWCGQSGRDLRAAHTCGHRSSPSEPETCSDYTLLLRVTVLTNH